jgi:hypothetical protein
VRIASGRRGAIGTERGGEREGVRARTDVVQFVLAPLSLSAYSLLLEVITTQRP